MAWVCFGLARSGERRPNRGILASLTAGIYDHLMTHGLAEAVDRVRTEAVDQVDFAKIEKAELGRFLARHLAREFERIASDQDPERQLGLANRLLEALFSEEKAQPEHAEALVARAERLLAVYRHTPPARPLTPIGESTLLTRAPGEPRLGPGLKREIETAEAVDVIAAFITRPGLRLLWPELEAFSRRGGKLRVLTTVFTGSTEVEAVEDVARLPNASIRVSYDVQRTRLHAKAWLFTRHRDGEDLHTAYVGSANLTKTALSEGHEWTMKASARDLPDVVKKFRGAFEVLWNDAEFEEYQPSDKSRNRLRAALKAERTSNVSEALDTSFFTLSPFAYQAEILDKLVAERTLHGSTKNLVVAATGTGKTMVSAFDYARQVESAGVRPRMLFLAHRREILEQSRRTFRHVLRDGAFGELWVDGEEPTKFDHVFASVQSASRALAGKLPADHFTYVVVDECHHLPADSYQRLLGYLTPGILLGLTATPERSDGKSLLPDFNGRIAAELRLWHALEKQLLAPFEYYGLSDGVDLGHVKWSRTGYGVAELEGVYTGNEARVDLVVAQLRKRVSRLEGVRALAFCVSVKHAEYMAKALTERGLRAVAVHGESSEEARSSARGLLERREIQVICTCDLYNEGVDLPFVDTLLLLRPTASATLFMQQLGRGLRLHPEKTGCLVLDFIGQHRTEFRFDAIYSALTGIARGGLREAVGEGFPYLPSGCVLELDAVAQKTVLESLRRQVPNAKRLAEELREVAARQEGRPPTLREFLDASGRDLEDVYEKGGGYTSLLARAGMGSEPDEETAGLSKRLGRLLHVDEPARLASYVAAVGDGPLPSEYSRRLSMLDFVLNRRGLLRDEATVREYLRKPEIASEVRGLVEVLDGQIPFANDIYPVAEWPLALHRHYTRREIMVAVGDANEGETGSEPQGGVMMLKEEKRELLFITLDKSGKSFSPSTRYRDYAMSPKLFHWESQSAASVHRTGKRYIESPGNGWTFHLFVRLNPDVTAFRYLGPATMKSWEGDKPIAIVWELEHAMGPWVEKYRLG